MSTWLLVLRLTLALGVVLGLMWLAARMVRKAGLGRNTGVMEVLARQQLGRGSQVAVLRVADQALIIGVTDSKVTLLAETDLEAVEAAQAAAEAQRVARTTVPVPGMSATPAAAGLPVGSVGASALATGKLHGSILAPSTWRQALQAIQERTVRSR